MAVKISIKPEGDDPEMDMLPEEQQMMDMEGDMPEMDGEDDMAGMAEGNEAPALADVVPEANTDPEDRMEAIAAQLESAKETMQTAPEPMPGEPTPPPGDDEWAMFEADYPDIAGPIKKLLEARTQRHGADMQAVHTRIFEEAMDAARPDWRDLRDDPAFGQWMQANPDQQTAAQVPGVRAALKVLSAYDASLKGNDIAKTRADRLKGAEATPAKGGRAPSLSDSLEGWAAE